MVEISLVKTKREQRDFIEFPNRLYKDSRYYVPPLYIDEKKIFNKDYVYYDTCEAVYFLARRNGKTVGRISGIIQKASNEKMNEKRVRFTRFDSIDDNEVAAALFNAVEEWGKKKGMDAVCGPLGFSDLEREGLLIEGFGEMSTYEEQYNYDYYEKLIENLGYKKEVDWLESKIYLPEKSDDSLIKIADTIVERHGLHYAKADNTKEFIKKYSEGFFALLDRSYAKLYGTVPFTDNMKKMLIGNFKFAIDMRFVGLLLDKNEKAVCFAICFPSLSHAMRISGGHLTPWALIKLHHDIKNPKVIDLGLVGVDPDYTNCGIGIAAFARLYKMLKTPGVEYAETNLNLEDNYAILNQWKRFKSVQHKRRRSYIKKL